MKTRTLAIAGAAMALCGSLLATAQAQPKPAAKPQQTPMPLAQAKRTVSMLNDLYVTSVVGIHGTYVKDPGTPAAAVVARQVFTSMKEKGWPETRWLSTTGRPFNPESNPKDQFEKDAIVELKKGTARFERVENGELRVATLVPIVDKSCLMCHTKDKVGDPIGGLSYRVKLSGLK